MGEIFHERKDYIDHRPIPITGPVSKVKIQLKLIVICILEKLQLSLEDACAIAIE